MSPIDKILPANLLEALPVSAEDWADTPKSVQDLVIGLLKRFQALEAEVARLREQVNRNSGNSSQPPSRDGPGVVRHTGGGKKASGRRHGGQAGHTGTQRKLVAVEELKAAYDIKPTNCRRCGGILSGEDPSPDRHQVAEIPPAKVEVTEYRLHTLNCPICGAKTRAELPEGVPQGGFGPRLQAMVSILSGRYHLSKRETVGILDDFFKVDLGLGSVPNLEKRTSVAIASVVEEARSYARSQAAVHQDETGWKEGLKKAWMWVLATQHVTVFMIDLHRSAEVAKKMLGIDFKGVLNTDRWSAYNWLDNRYRQLCWSHLRRDFEAFVERSGESQAVGEVLLTLVNQMFTWWHRVRDGTLSRTQFQEQMRPIRTQVGELLRQGTSCTQTGTAGTCRDILKREAALWTFVDVEGVEPTNNLAERQIRPGVLWRNSSFGTQSEAGSRFVERIMTVVTTLKQQGRNPLDYLTEACDAANRGRSAPSLLPTLSMLTG
jgi:Transposase IS66 family.